MKTVTDRGRSKRIDVVVSFAETFVNLMRDTVNPGHHSDTVGSSAAKTRKPLQNPS